MALFKGDRIGTFEVVSPLGAGGMGEVYRARDARLGRDVAIKILPAAFTQDKDRLVRFEREARVLASLNHPNIGAIYGLEDTGSTRALVLELVEGETLADRLRDRGALPASEALAIARQLADALDAAHDKGIVHRDLKPANIKVGADGIVKVLDFGLAKTAAFPDSELESTISGTHEGIVLGTVGYMSPEQARGQALDKRADIWAFGCVLYEMLTGRGPFAAPTLSDVIARILGDTPDFAALPNDTPPGLVRLIKRCLERDPKRRLRDLGDWELATGVETVPATVAKPGSKGWMVATIAFALIAAALAAYVLTRPAPAAGEPPAIVRLEMPVSVRLLDTSAFAVSPDGRRVAFIGASADGTPRLWSRSLDTLETKPIGGSEGEVAFNSTLFWSPDGRSIGFYADGRIKRIDSGGGAAQVVCTARGVLVGGAWTRTDVIVMGNTGGGLVRCPAGGGAATAVTAVANENSLDLLPSVLPDARHLLYLHVSRAEPSENGIFVADLDAPPAEQSKERLIAAGFGAAYVATDTQSGRVLFVRDQALYAVPFDPVRRVLTGEAVQIAAPVGSFRDGAFFSATANVLVYRGIVPDVQLQWRRRNGETLGSVGEPGPYSGAALSPDGSRVALLRENRVSRADQDVWILDLNRDATTRLTSDPLLESVPAWTQDGKAVFIVVGHGAGDIWMQPIDGSPRSVLFERSAHPELRVNPLLATLSVADRGRLVVFPAEAADRAQTDLWTLSPLDRSIAPLVQQDFAQTHGTISPDGRWLAYASNESGVSEVFVRALTRTANRPPQVVGSAIPVSRGGGTAPRWRGDNKELFYLSPAGGVFAATVAGGEIGRPVQLFRAPGALTSWSVTADGQRMLLAMPAGEPRPMTVVLNWQSAVGR